MLCPTNYSHEWKVCGRVGLIAAFLKFAFSALSFAFLCALCVNAVVVAAEGENSVALVGATVIHPEREPGQALAANTTVIISGHRIQSVAPTGTQPIPEGATVIDARGKWIIPGLIDAHVHYFQSGNLYTRPDVADFTERVSFAQETARNKARLAATFKVWLASGVTGTVDVGGPMWNFEVREAARRTAEAPRVAVAGPLVSMVARPELDLGDAPIVKVSTPEEARALVQRELPHRPDYIKVWFIHRDGDDLVQQEAIVKAAGEAARAGGVRFAVHATELEVAKVALRAGADFLVHSVEDQLVDDEFIELARSRNVLYCPTLFVLDGYGLALSNRWQPTAAESRLADPQIVSALRDLEDMPKAEVPPGVRRLMARQTMVTHSRPAEQNLRKVWDAGISVVMGTDAGNIGTVHGPSVFREMQAMQEAGLTLLEVLRAATTNGARALGMEQELGTIAPGKLADLVVLDADPLERVDNLSRIHRVVKDGRVYDPDELVRSIR